MLHVMKLELLKKNPENYIFKGTEWLFQISH